MHNVLSIRIANTETGGAHRRLHIELHVSHSINRVVHLALQPCYNNKVKSNRKYGRGNSLLE